MRKLILVLGLRLRLLVQHFFHPLKAKFTLTKCDTYYQWQFTFFTSFAPTKIISSITQNRDKTWKESSVSNLILPLNEPQLAFLLLNPVANSSSSSFQLTSFTRASLTYWTANCVDHETVCCRSSMSIISDIILLCVLTKVHKDLRLGRPRPESAWTQDYLSIERAFNWSQPIHRWRPDLSGIQKMNWRPVVLFDSILSNYSFDLNAVFCSMNRDVN